MYIKKLYFLLFICCIIQSACKDSEKKATVVIYPRIGLDEKIYLSKVPFKGKPILLDSVVVKNNRDAIVFSYSNTQEEVYRLSSSFNKFKVTFISDSNRIVIHADYFAKTALIENSKATTSLLKFRKEQSDLSKKKDTVFFKNVIKYADTVKSPAAFVLVYDDINFGKDYTGLKSFIAHAVKRFPSYRAVGEIRRRSDLFIKIMTEEYNIGEQLPFITLPDEDGNHFSTAKLSGKIYFIDFWSTWCPNCLLFTPIKKRMYNIFPKEKLEMVSVALDAETGDWKQYIETEKLRWPQLIDQKMWEGSAVETLKFDSIPFNFLVSEKGMVLAKGIPADSLITVIQRFIKNKAPHN